MTYPYTLLGSPIGRQSVTIPANTSTSSTIKSILSSAGYTGPIRWFKILGVLADKTTQRPAITLASKRPGASAFVETDYTTNGEPVPAGMEYISAPSDLAGETGVRSDSGSTITVTIAYGS